MHKLTSGVNAADAERQMRWNLQLFAGEGASSGGDGGDGSSTAGTEAGQESMDNLGIPKQKLEKYRSIKAQQQPPRAEAPEQPQAKQDDAAPPEEASEETSDNADAEWDKALKNPDFNRRVQGIVQERVSKMRGQLEALNPVLEILGQKYGMEVSDVSKLDISELAKRVSEDDSYFEKKAEEMGSSPETARKVFQAELAEQRKDLTARDEMLRRHFDGLVAQAEALKQKVPNFDLETELRDDRFRRMTAPGGGWNVEQAFNAIHHDEIMKAAQEATARQAAQALSNSIQSGKNLPAENGSVQRAVAESRPKLYSQMTPEERRIEKARITGRPIGR